MPSVVKIGLVAPFEGRYRYVGYDAIYAARLAVQEINTSGGVNGWHLELVAYDDRATPEMARIAAQNLTTDPDVVAVIGHYHNASTTKAQETYVQAQMPLLVIGAGVPQARQTWHLAPAPSTLAHKMLEANPHKHTLPLPPEAHYILWGKDEVANALRAKIRLSGVQVMTDTSLTQTPQTSPTIILSTMAPHLAAENLRLWQQQGWRGHFVGSLEYATTDFAILAGDASDGAQFVTPYPLPQDLPQLDDWITRYQAMGPHVAPPGPYALPTYEAVHILAQAIAQATQTHAHPTRASVTESLFQVQRTGYLGTITWDNEGYWSHPTLATYTWQEAHFQLMP